MINPSKLKENLWLIEKNFEWLHKNLILNFSLRDDESFKENLKSSKPQKFLRKRYDYYTNKKLTNKWAIPSYEQYQYSVSFIRDFYHYHKSTLYGYLHARSRLIEILKQPSIISSYGKSEYKKLREEITLNLTELEFLKKK